MVSVVVAFTRLAQMYKYSGLASASDEDRNAPSAGVVGSRKVV